MLWKAPGATEPAVSSAASPTGGMLVPVGGGPLAKGEADAVTVRPVAEWMAGDRTGRRHHPGGAIW